VVLEAEAIVGPAEADAEAVRAVALGDQGALRGLYDRYGRMIHSIALGITGDAHAAEECTQDVFMALWRSATSFDPARSRVSTWLCTIARNRALDAARAAARRPTPHGEVPEVGMAPDTADLIVHADAAVQVAEAMALLPAPQFDVLQLAYFDGLSQAEIASRLGVPVGTVKSRMRLAMNRMREIVTDLGPEA
jgi:RNA polymerase sigma-70 factor, ECF subfamily